MLPSIFVDGLMNHYFIHRLTSSYMLYYIELFLIYFMRCLINFYDIKNKIPPSINSNNIFILILFPVSTLEVSYHFILYINFNLIYKIRIG